MKKQSHLAGCIILMVGILLFLFDTGFAEEKQTDFTLDPVVVTARGQDTDSQTGDVDQVNTPSFFSTITRDEFEGKMENLSDVIESQAGIQVRQSGGLGSFSTVSMRGASSDQVMVFMDGVLLNDASGGGVDLSNIALADVDSVEIYQGTSPINFGKTSIGGVVNIQTRRSKKGFNANAIAGYGSFNTRKLSAFINHKPGKWDYLISADYMDSDNDFEIDNDNGTPDNPSDDRTEDRNNAQFDQSNVLARLGLDFTPKARIDVTNKWFSKNQGIPSWNNSPRAETELDTERNISTLKLTLNDVTPLHLNTSTQVDYLVKQEVYDDADNHIGLGRQKSRYDTDRLSGRFFAEWLTDRHALRLTVDALNETYEAENELSGEKTNDSDRRSFSAGIQDTVFFANDRLSITPAVRYTHISDDFSADGDALGIDPVDDARTNDHFMPQIGVKFQASDHVTVKSNLARYFREPSFFELFGDRGIFLGNPELEAESGVNFDIGLQYFRQWSEGRLNRLSAKAVYFYSQVDDMITRTYNARGIGKADNISEASINGIETRISAEVFENLRLIGQYTFQDAENKSRIASFDGNQLPGKFRHSWLGRIEYNWRQLKLYTEYINESDMYYDSANLLEASTKTEVNCGLSYLMDSWRISLEAKNIGDDRYEEFNGYPLPGRSFFASIKYSL
ncbi:MAG TPA: TonB-dependent receptor [Desulfosalsimonadaceae bacterium]|nr:TonB-dependent receptor [Desulfosalsimonadaceae bacterium]